MAPFTTISCDGPSESHYWAELATKEVLGLVRVAFIAIDEADEVPYSINDVAGILDGEPRFQKAASKYTAQAASGERVVLDGWKRPLRMQRRGEQLVIYSIGPDGRDHGGVPDDLAIVYDLSRREWVSGSGPRPLQQR